MERAVDYLELYYKEKGYNCAETVLHAANDAWKLGLSEDAMKLMAGFGGGMGSRNICGAISGGVAALSSRFVNGSGHKSPELMKLVRTFVQTVEKELGSTQCRDLNPKFATKEERCYPTIKRITEILDQVYAEA